MHATTTTTAMTTTTLKCVLGKYLPWYVKQLCKNLRLIQIKSNQSCFFSFSLDSNGGDICFNTDFFHKAVNLIYAKMNAIINKFPWNVKTLVNEQRRRRASWMLLVHEMWTLHKRMHCNYENSVLWHFFTLIITHFVKTNIISYITFCCPTSKAEFRVHLHMPFNLFVFF